MHGKGTRDKKKGKFKREDTPRGTEGKECTKKVSHNNKNNNRA